MFLEIKTKYFLSIDILTQFDLNDLDKISNKNE